MTEVVKAAAWFEQRCRFSIPVGVVFDTDTVEFVERDGPPVRIARSAWPPLEAAAQRFPRPPRLVLDDCFQAPAAAVGWCVFEVRAWEDASGEEWKETPAGRVRKALDLIAEGRLHRYMERLGLPWRKLDLSLNGDRDPPKTAVRWRVRYPDLWLRVLSSRATDPVVMRALLYENPHMALASALGETRPDRALAAVYWAALSFDTDAFELAFPHLAPVLGEVDRDSLRRRLTAGFPALVAGASMLADTLWARPFVETAYGRARPRPERKADAVAWWISGTEEDILRCMAVTASHCAEEGVTVTGTDLRRFPVPAAPSVYGIVERERALWWSEALQTLAHLGNPLGWVSLNPQIEVAI